MLLQGLGIVRGKETSLLCNLGGNDLITDKRVFLRARPVKLRRVPSKSSSELAAAEPQSVSAAYGAVHQRGAETIQLRATNSTARRVMHIQPGIRVPFVLNVNTKRCRQLWVSEVNMRWKDTEGQVGGQSTLLCSFKLDVCNQKERYPSR